jgi:FkbM family methyltransferase
MLFFYKRPLDAFRRYVFGTGNYPAIIEGRTPIGTVKIKISHPHDMQTINEVFCRKDYPVAASDARIVDIGANIGVSALYFLTRRPDVFCYLFEPLPANIARLIENLKPFEGRYKLYKKAVFTHDGVVDFNVEPVGRYSQIASDEHRRNGMANCIQVECCDINSALGEVIKDGKIDLIKIDIEGLEQVIIRAIDPDLRSSIGRIVYETNIAGRVAEVVPSRSDLQGGSLV